MKRFLKRLLAPIERRLDQWLEREMEAAKHDPDISYEQYKKMKQKYLELKAEAPQKGTP
jgi:hypothetical protein